MSTEGGKARLHGHILDILLDREIRNSLSETEKIRQGKMRKKSQHDDFQRMTELKRIGRGSWDGLESNVSFFATCGKLHSWSVSSPSPIYSVDQEFSQLLTGVAQVCFDRAIFAPQLLCDRFDG